MKKNLFLALVAMTVISCSDDSESTNGDVTLKASAFSSTGNSLTAKGSTSTVVITDFDINIGTIKFKKVDSDKIKGTEIVFDNAKLNGPFLLDLFNTNVPLSQLITTVATPNGTYGGIKLKFQKSTVEGEMLNKTYLIKGTINGKDFAIWSSKDADLEIHFDDATKEFTVKGNKVSLNVKIELDSLLAKIADLANKDLLSDGDGDGVIEISTDDDDNNSNIGISIKALLESASKLDDKD